jgi:1-pyrroline-5-carboxylate dehydrogenase
MLDAITQVPAPYNEPVHSFAPGSGERTALEAKLKELAAERAELTMTIGGEQRLGGWCFSRGVPRLIAAA